MLSLLLLTALSAARGPRALPGSDLVVYAPRLDRLVGLNAFLSRAGERSVMLRPSSYSSEFHPLLPVDPLRPESLVAAGIDPSAQATVSLQGDTRVTCTVLKDPALFEKRAKERLAMLGTVSSLHASHVTVQVAKSGLTAPGGYLLLGQEACAVTGTSLVPETFKKLAAWMAGPQRQPTPSSAGLPGVLYLYSRGSVLGLEGTGRSLVVEGRSRSPKLALSLTPTTRTQAAGAQPSGLAWVRLHAEPRALAATARRSVQEACRACTGAAWDAFLGALEPALTGEALSRVDRVKVETTLTTPEGRFAALKQATLLELKSPESVRAALQALAKDAGLGAPTPEGDVQVELPAAVARLGVRGHWLFVSNDDAAFTAASEVFSASARQPAHPLEATLDPKLASRALRQIPLLDVLASPELAGLFAAGTELGALLSVSESVRLWAQPEPGGSGSRFQLTWRLPAP